MPATSNLKDIAAALSERVDPEAEREAAKERLAESMAVAERFPKGPVEPSGNACRICGVAVPDGEGATDGGTYTRPNSDPPPPGAMNIRWADGPRGPRSAVMMKYDLPEWRVCAECSGVERSTRDDRARAAVLFALDIPQPWSGYRDAVAHVNAEFGSLAYDAADGAGHADHGYAHRFQHLGARKLDRVRERFDRIMHPRPERYRDGRPCSQCGRSHSLKWHTVHVQVAAMRADDAALLVCDDCQPQTQLAADQAERERPNFTIADATASRAAGVPLTPGLAKKVGFVVARRHPDYLTDAERGPFAYLDPDDLAALRTFARSQPREEERMPRADGRLQVPAVPDASSG